MFEASELKQYQLFDQDKFIGLVRYNPDINYKERMMRPFIRCKLRIIESIGKVNYAYLDQFIMMALNDIYRHINEGKNEVEVKNRIMEYQELYGLWQKVLVARQNRDFNINSYYDDLIYRLYLKGYKN